MHASTPSGPTMLRGAAALMGALNLYVAFHFSESTWVNFKLFGGLGLMVLFVLAQGAVLARYTQSEEGK